MRQDRGVQSAPQPLAAPRLTSLDGLRGAAAAAVLLFHVGSLSPTVAGYVIDGAPAPAPLTAAWWYLASPLRLLSAGEEAVFVFFVLSGLVLTLPFVHSGRSDWVRFYVARVPRLLLPAFASIVLSFALVKIVSRDPAASYSTWLRQPFNPLEATVADIVREIDLLFSPNTLNGPLWSLRWEALFSLALPALLGLILLIPGARRSPRVHIALVGSTLVCLIVVGLYSGSSTMVHIPIFGFGVLIALNISRWRRSTAPWCGGLVCAIACVALVSAAVLRPYVAPSGTVAVGARVLTILGAAALVAVIAAHWPNRGVLSAGPAQWLGRISFSLYLVHQPILVTSAFIFGERAWPIAAVAGGVASILCAWLFYLIVERPSHRWSRRLGRAASDRYRELNQELDRSGVSAGRHIQPDQPPV